MAGEISAVITPEVSEQEQLKAQQRRLNYMRKLQTRIYKKEKLIKDKEASMTKFLLDIKKHVEAEKLRHRQETDLLERELQELREQLQKAKDGKETEEEAPMEDLEEILEDGDAEKLQLKERLHKAEAANVAMQQQLQQFQSQMTAFMQAQQTPSPSVAPPGLAFSPDQAVKTPVIKLDEAIAVARRETRRDPLQPFGVRRSTLRSRTPSGTYTPSPGRPEDGGRNHGQDKVGRHGQLREASMQRRLQDALNGQLGQLARLLGLWTSTFICGDGLVMSPKWMKFLVHCRTLYEMNRPLAWELLDVSYGMCRFARNITSILLGSLTLGCLLRPSTTSIRSTTKGLLPKRSYWICCLWFFLMILPMAAASEDEHIRQALRTRNQAVCPSAGSDVQFQMAVGQAECRIYTTCKEPGLLSNHPSTRCYSNAFTNRSTNAISTSN